MNNLLIYFIVALANAFEIIGFNRACYYVLDNFKICNYSTKNNIYKQVDEESKMILWRVGVWSDKTFGEFWSKPIHSCPTCMASVHGFLPFWITYNHFDLTGIVYWLCYTLVLSGIATVLNK